MTDDRLRPRKSPCATCPYRRDVPSGVWDASEYEKLRGYDGSTPDQAVAGAFGLFLCHQRDGNLCAGWVGCHDMTQNLAVRLHSAKVDPSVFSYKSPVPLFRSGAEAADHGERDMEEPGERARTKISNLLRSRRLRGRGKS